MSIPFAMFASLDTGETAMQIEIRKEHGKWTKLPSSQWDFAIWAVAAYMNLSHRDAAAKLKDGYRPFVQDFGGAYVRAA